MKVILLVLLLCGLVAHQSPAQTTAAPATAPAPTDTTNLAVYAGSYTFASGSPISNYAVTVKDGSLYGDAGMGNFKLVKQPKANTFQSTSSYGSMITFVRDATTKLVTGLTLAAQGQEISATKDK